MTQKYKYDEKTNSYIPIEEEEKTSSDRNDDKLIAILIWASNFVIPLVAGVIAYFYYENKNEFLRNTGKEAINYGISAVLYGALLTVSFFLLIGIVFVPILICYCIAIPVIGILKATEYKVYKPHFALRLLN